ncbi:sulfotransferase [Erythrobacter litoralis]|uniref:sulfotransferase family protein n=1 Tax=Erythrobacter litoralis TaxID=39960 RepID=UPI0024354177|nr:sulfotransferase [Erythrobacter litoralis]MDG6078649.1 sulfotransferase [Erythrobacter litoralis]
MSRVPPRPHPLARSVAAERANAMLERAWARGCASKPSLDPDRIWYDAAKGYSPQDERSIRSEEDVADFRERLNWLCRSLREEADLNALGLVMAYGQLRKAVRERHQLGRLWNEKPKLARTQIAPPIAVVGVMRSGTTRVHRLLAADPRHCGTRFGDSHYPVPSSPDLRPLKARVGLALLGRLDPWLQIMHPVTPTGIDEEIGWLAAALSPPSYEAQWTIPSFVRWSEARDARPVYAEFARILRTDAAHHGNAGKTRILKCPQFTEDLPALLSAFPDLRIVATARDPDAVWRSAVSMVTCQSGYQTRSPDLTRVEAECDRKLRYRSASMDEGLKGTDRPVARVSFSELNRDWREAVSKIYAQIGLTLDASALRAMEAEVSRTPKRSLASHRKQIDDFALERPRPPAEAVSL